MVTKITGIVVGVIGLVIVANIINSETNAALLGSTANTIVAFIVVGMAIGLLVAGFSFAKGAG